MHCRVRSLSIACCDHRRSEQFYREVLGAEPYLTEDPGYGCPHLQLGGLVLAFVPNAAQATPARFPDDAMVFLTLEVDDLEAMVSHCERLEVTVVEPSDGQTMLIADPDGLVIELWEKEP